MLSPCEIGRMYSAEASLLCAVTPIRCTPVDAVQNDAQRDSFSQGIRTTDTTLTLVAWVRANSFQMLKRA
jgi:hypothetical protein